jgi:hypothetical protein
MLVDPAAMLLLQTFGINPSAFTTARDEYQQPAFQRGIYVACPFACTVGRWSKGYGGSGRVHLFCELGI